MFDLEVTCVCVCRDVWIDCKRTGTLVCIEAAR